MEQVQTIVCPNCGAVTASNQNCEYCGSMLTKVASVLCKEADDAKSILGKLGFGKSAYVSSNILQAVERTITQRNKHNTVVESYQPIIQSKYAFFDEIRGHYNESEEEKFKSSISKAQESDSSGLLGLQIKDPLSMSIILSSSSKTPLLMIKCYMLLDITNNWYSDLEKFEIAKLFVKEQVGDFMILATSLDSDATTSAQIIKYILKKFFGKTDVECTFDTYGIINEEIYEISTEKKKKNDAAIEKAEKEYMNQVIKEQTSYIWNIQRESIFPQFSKILYIAAILAMGVYLGNLYSLTTALILLGSTIVLIMIVNSISKSRRINEIKDLETFKTKFCRVKRPDISSYPKFLEE